MTVDYIDHTDDGNLRAPVRWAKAPGITFVLEVAPDGRLVEFLARADGSSSVSARGLRQAPIGEMQRAVREEAAAIVEGWRASAKKRQLRPSLLEDVEDIARDFVERERPGAAGRGDSQYTALAAMYVDLLNQGEARPVRALAAQLHLGEKTIRNYLFKARERGLLTSLGRGRAGGQLTDKARRILDGHRQTQG